MKKKAIVPLAIIGGSLLVILVAVSGGRDDAGDPTLTPAGIAEGGGSGDGTPASSPVPAGSSGTIVATVSFTGEAPAPRKIKMTPECGKGPNVDESVLVQDGKLANVMVRVIEGAPPEQGDGQGTEVVQEGCVYRPRVSGIVAGESVAVTSKDAFLHNVHTFKGDVSIFNKGQPMPSTFVKEASEFTANGEVVQDGPIAFKCDVHPWMLAWVVVNPNRHFAVTGKDGVARITLPTGKYTLESWHETFGTRTAEVEVAEGEPVEVAFQY